jgi:hypothetical protein
MLFLYAFYHFQNVQTDLKKKIQNRKLHENHSVECVLCHAVEMTDR